MAAAVRASSVARTSFAWVSIFACALSRICSTCPEMACSIKGPSNGVFLASLLLLSTWLFTESRFA